MVGRELSNCRKNFVLKATTAFLIPHALFNVLLHRPLKAKRTCQLIGSVCRPRLDAGGILVFPPAASAETSEIALPSDRAYPESITAAPDGTLYVAAPRSAAYGE